MALDASDDDDGFAERAILLLLRPRLLLLLLLLTDGEGVRPDVDALRSPDDVARADADDATLAADADGADAVDDDRIQRPIRWQLSSLIAVATKLSAMWSDDIGTSQRTDASVSTPVGHSLTL